MAHGTRQILLVGAGAVGLAYGRHLQAGGAQVAFFVKPKHAASARDGFAMYPLNTKAGKRREPVRFEGFDVLTTMDEVRARRWDQVWLCVSAPALRAGDWFEELAGAMGDATLVSLTPGLEDRAIITARVPEERVVEGMINMISYQAPLATETVPDPGVAYWYPGKNPFSGPADRVAGVVEALSAGGWKAKAVRDVTRSGTFGSAVLMPHLVALEASGWKFAPFRKSEVLPLASRASREAMKVVAAYRGERRPMHHVLIRPWLLKLLTRLAPRVLPLDIETYLGYHFTKVGDQTELLLDSYLAVAAEKGLDVPAIRELRERLARVRAAEAEVEAPDRRGKLAAG
ncbi:MAG: ketopantoate reductase [Myxococcales bacterium]|nr:ketopantoate reductase [Myxococcales bacterium]MCB9735770.1 ketopantoate reductase [Deltaproteobacteria bacterium]